MRLRSRSMAASVTWRARRSVHDGSESGTRHAYCCRKQRQNRVGCSETKREDQQMRSKNQISIGGRSRLCDKDRRRTAETESEGDSGGDERGWGVSGIAHRIHCDTEACGCPESLTLDDPGLFQVRCWDQQQTTAETRRIWRFSVFFSGAEGEKASERYKGRRGVTLAESTVDITSHRSHSQTDHNSESAGPAHLSASCGHSADMSILRTSHCHVPCGRAALPKPRRRSPTLLPRAVRFAHVRSGTQSLHGLGRSIVSRNFRRDSHPPRAHSPSAIHRGGLSYTRALSRIFGPRLTSS